MNFQKTAQNALYLVHAMFGRRGFHGFAIGKMVILATLPLTGRYKGWYYTKLVSYVIIFYLETDWSRIRPLPSTNLTEYGSQSEMWSPSFTTECRVVSFDYSANCGHSCLVFRCE